ncbi:MAG TPA: hypothetical protein VER10_12675 [Mycobacterium sp.]|jgi:hypothetical protein|nr:hypothetical protein [Mycobacterium sp.]
MPTDVPSDSAPTRSVGPASPFIRVSRGQIYVTGTGFLPNQPVTVRITNSGEGVVDYLTYISDADGRVDAALPETAAIQTGHITVTDQRRDPAGDCGLLWSNTVIVTPDST